MDISEVRAQVARNELLRLIKDIGLPLCLFGTVTEVSAPNASVRLDGDTESTVCSDMVGCSVDDRCIVANIKNMAVVIAAIGGTDTSDKADVDHEHAASDITSGSLSVARGGTGRASLTSGQYLVGSGTSAVLLKTKAQVLSDIGAAASSHNHPTGDINSGTFGVARGGTGNGTFTAGSYLIGNGTSALESKTPAEVLDDIGAAASSHEHAASDVTSGTLAIARIPTITVAKGGTGNDTLTSGSYLVGNGTSAVSLKTPAQVLSDIGAAASSHTHNYLPLAGGTMTGNLVMEDKGVYIDSDSLTDGTAPSSNTNGRTLQFRDSANVNIVSVNPRYLTDGRQGLDMYARRVINGTAVTNSLDLWIDAEGNRTVTVTSAAAWRSALGLGTSGAFPLTLAQGGTNGTTAAAARTNLGIAPTQLYNNTGNGINTAVSLSDSVANYTRIKIYFKDNNHKKCPCQEFYGLAASDTFSIYDVEASSATTTYVRRTCYTVSSNGKTLTPSLGGDFGVNHSTKVIGAATTTATNELYIYRVEGYTF